MLLLLLPLQHICFVRQIGRKRDLVHGETKPPCLYEMRKTEGAVIYQRFSITAHSLKHEGR